MRLFEWIHDEKFYLRKLIKFYKDMGLLAKALPPVFEDGAWGLHVADDEQWESDYQQQHHTGMFMYFFPDYNRCGNKDEDVNYTMHINSVVVSEEKRGSGLGSKIIEGMIKIFGDDLGEIELADFSNSTFWKKMEIKYPNIKWTFE